MSFDPITAGGALGLFFVSVFNAVNIRRTHRDIKSPNGETTGAAVHSTKQTTEAVQREVKAARREAKEAARRAEDASREAREAAELARAASAISADAAQQLGEFLREWDTVDLEDDD